MREKFVALDAVRGIGAICVVFAHIAYREELPLAFRHAAPAVDLFFVLSGFVIAHAYENALRTSMTFQQYFRIRMIRLYPTILIGGLIGIAVAAWLPADPSYSFATAVALQVLLLPMLAANHLIFPLNGPHWSLFFELFINFVHAGVAKHLTTRRLVIVLGLGALALLACALYFHSLDLGSQRRTFFGGFARALFSFTLGLLLYRLRGVWQPRIPKVSPFLCMAAFAIGMAAPIPREFGLIYELAIVFLLYPLLVMFSTNAEAPPKWQPFFEWLGMISYPLYAIHLPILDFFDVWLSPPTVPHLYKLLGWGSVVAGCILLAWAIILVDAPFRAWLSKVTRRRPANASA